MQSKTKQSIRGWDKEMTHDRLTLAAVLRDFDIRLAVVVLVRQRNRNAGLYLRSDYQVRICLEAFDLKIHSGSGWRASGRERESYKMVKWA